MWKKTYIYVNYIMYVFRVCSSTILIVTDFHLLTSITTYTDNNYDMDGVDAMRCDVFHDDGNSMVVSMTIMVMLLVVFIWIVIPM